MTFVNVQQPGRSEANTFQLVLNADGTIRFAYNGIGNKHAHVGLSVGLFCGASEDPLDHQLEFHAGAADAPCLLIL